MAKVEASSEKNENTLRKTIAIVTGASSGLGVEFVRQLLERQGIDEIWLIARRQDLLENVSKAAPPGKTAVIVADLTDHDQMAKITSKLKTENPQIRWLINNAGFGKIGPFEATPVEVYSNMIELNIRALTELIHFCLPYCEKGSHIVNVGSSAGYQPLPQFSVYAATKSYVIYFSYALREELRDRGISVTVVAPGPVATEFFQVAAPGVKQPPAMIFAEPKDVVQQALKNAENDCATAIYGVTVKATRVLGHVLPKSLVAKTVQWMFTSGKMPF